MKIIINKNELSSALKIAKIVVGKSWMPILKSVKISTIGDEEISILGTDLENWIDIKIKAECEKPGSAIIDIKALLLGLKAFHNRKIIIQTNSDEEISLLEVSEGLFENPINKETKLGSLKEEDWPAKEFKVKKGSERKIKFGNFLRAFKNLRCSWIIDSAKGVQIDFDGKSIAEAVSVNNHTMTKTTILMKGKSLKFIITPEMADIVLSFIEATQKAFQKKERSEIIISEIEESPNWIGLLTDKIKLYFRTTENETFPDKEIYDEKTHTSSFKNHTLIVFNRNELITACNLILDNSDDQFYMMSLIRKKGNGIVEVQGANFKGYFEISCQGSVQEFAFGINPYYLKRILENFTESRIEMLIGKDENEHAPIKIEENGIIHVIMPMRL